MTTQDMNQIARQISEKKGYLSKLVATPLDTIATACVAWLDDVDKLDEYLQQAKHILPYCNTLYVADRSFLQLSSNISTDAVRPEYRGQDLSKQPYLQATIPLKGLVLSNCYQDSHTTSACITVMQAIQKNGDLLGLLIADFNLSDLPLPNDITRMMNNWQQFKGDPAIRGSLFSQQRTSSFLDRHIDDVHAVIQSLMIQNGVFHFKLHYSSSRVTLWLYDQPHHYRVHNIDDLVNGLVSASYPERSYPADACINADLLGIALNQFKALRFADESVYLRSASVNIINGMVGLNFSCDGSHYIPVQEFIDNSMGYWLGSLKSA